jgi:hypothetical protein
VLRVLQLGREIGLNSKNKDCGDLEPRAVGSGDRKLLRGTAGIRSF